MSKYTKKTDEERKKEIEDLTSKIENGVKEYTETPKQLKEYLTFMSKFYNYSLSNCFIMQSQFKGAIAVGSFKFWKDKGFSVNKGEKGIKILVPNKLTPKFLDEKGNWRPIKEAEEKQKAKIENGELKKSGSKLYFSIGNVFDISQTNAKAEDLPKVFPNRWLEGNLKEYNVLYKGLENIAKSIGVNIIEAKEELGVAKGCSYTLSKEVALNPRNSQLQNFKTLLHELAHAKLHNIENNNEYNSAEKEFQAELTAFTVCSYFNIDTSEYSLNYLSHWSKGEIRDKQNLLREVHETVKEYIEVLEEALIKEKDNILSNKAPVHDELGAFFDGNELQESIYIYYKETPEENKKVSSIEELKEYINAYMEPYFEYAYEDKESNSDNEEVKSKWSKDEILEWCKANDIEISKENPVKSIESNMIINEGFISSSGGAENGTVVDEMIILNFSTLTNKEIEYIYESIKKLDKDGWIELKKVKDKTNINIHNEYDYEENIGVFENLEGNDLIGYYEKAKFAEIVDSEFIGAYEKVIYGEYINKDEYKEFRNEIRKDTVLEIAKRYPDEVKNILGNYNENNKEYCMISKNKEKEIMMKVKDHEEWLNTKGVKGKQLNLENENLRGMKFLDVDLRSANLRNTDLRDCIVFADLKGANLTGSKIENTKWIGSNLGKITIEANKLNLIEYQINQELDKHKYANKGLTTNKKKQKLERDI